MVNCTQGKDRTGMVILLVLLLCNVDINAISQDYVKSEPELEPEKAARMEEITSIGLDESFAGCPSDFCARIAQHLQSTYGDLPSYLNNIGVDATQRDRIRGFLQIER